MADLFDQLAAPRTCALHGSYRRPIKGPRYLTGVFQPTTELVGFGCHGPVAIDRCTLTERGRLPYPIDASPPTTPARRPKMYPLSSRDGAIVRKIGLDLLGG
ncbi:hypothetical protein ABZ806_23500 [Spirillospora sp. NPDC047418]